MGTVAGRSSAAIRRGTLRPTYSAESGRGFERDADDAGNANEVGILGEECGLVSLRN